MPAHPASIAQNEQFVKSIYPLGGDAYSAVGFSESNVHFLVGKAGVIAIDTSDSTQAAVWDWFTCR